jgi:hypothetical protein
MGTQHAVNGLSLHIRARLPLAERILNSNQHQIANSPFQEGVKYGSVCQALCDPFLEGLAANARFQVNLRLGARFVESAPKLC